MDKVAYVDLYAGTGCFRDGTKSTPLLILERAIADPILNTSLVTVFNDSDDQSVQDLGDSIAALPSVASLRYKPRLYSYEVGEQIASELERVERVPTLLFADPWGYKGLTLGLINSVIKDWACECVFFFNYNRVNPGLSNRGVSAHMDGLFGRDGAATLRARLAGLPPPQRESLILREMNAALRDQYGKYVVTFRFAREDGKRTSHYLVHVSKNFKGYDIMKPIMARHSSSFEDGVPSFEYNPWKIRQPTLLGLHRPLDELKHVLLHSFRGRRLSMRQIYEDHSPGTPYLSGNYKSVLAQLEAEGTVIADPPASGRRTGTFADSVMVTFPS